MLEHLLKALNDDRLVLPLTSGILRGQAQLARRIQSVLQLLNEPVPFLCWDGRGIDKIKRELGLSRRLVYVLTSGAARPRKSDIQLGDGNADLVVKGNGIHCCFSSCLLFFLI